MSIDSLSDNVSGAGLVSLRPAVFGLRHAVSSGHHLASQAALEILDAGGNAVDAGVAAGLVMSVVQSEMVNFAGVAPILIYLAKTRRVLSISGLGWWPRALDPRIFVDRFGGDIPDGVWRTVTPAAPDAWLLALKKFGTMRFCDVSQAALRHARDGFVMYPFMALMLDAFKEGYARWDSNARIYLPNGAPPKAGDVFKQEDLARTFDYMRACEQACAGGRAAGIRAARDAFYKGDIAREIVRHQAQEGGFLNMEDLAAYQSEIEPALAVTTRGGVLHSCGAWCQGPIFPQLMNVLERFDLESFGHNSADYLHVLAESIKLCFADRHAYFGDPRFVNVPIETLLDVSYAIGQAGRIDMQRATAGMPAPGLGELVQALARAPRGEASLDTSYVGVVDAEGNVFSATPSDVSYDTPVTPGLGICPSSRGSQSWADFSSPSCVAPGKRPRLTPNPSIGFMADGGVCAFGTPGGDVQIQAMAQVWLNITRFGMDIQAAVEAPRLGSYSFPDSFEPHAYEPGRLNVESRISEDIVSDLAQRGHDVRLWPDFAWRAGAVCFTKRDSNGVVSAAADPRRPAYALAT